MATLFLVVCTFAALLVPDRAQMRAGREAEAVLLESTS
jgi:hypothetical protein